MLTKRMICALCALLLTLAAPAVQADDAGTGAPDGALVLDLEGDAARLDGTPVPEDDPDAAVYTAHDIVYYEAGHDFTYGEGTAADEHTPEEAAAHTVVHITQPGAYILRGALDPGQIAVDLGEDAASDPDAVVTLVLDGADVTCTVAPAVIFYNVYECDQTEDQDAEPDLSDAGARVIIADGSENDVAGSYVARIYKSCTLSEDGLSVTDSKKLHKYDGALYSKMSMTVSGGPAGDGVLRLTAANEGLDTEMHLAVNGGVLYIASGNDGVNCNEDGVSVITFNGGETHITVTGGTGEGDGVDSNGWLVVNGGVLTAQACSSSMDSGLDSANGISIRGGTVAACGNMLDPVDSAGQCCAVFTFSRRQAGGTHYVLTGADRTERICFTPDNDHASLLLSSPALTAGEGYSLLADGTAVAVSAGGAGGGMPGDMRGGGMRGGGMPGGDMPGGDMPGGDMPGSDMPGGTAPEPPNGNTPELPDGTVPELPDGNAPEPPDGAAGPMDQPDDAPASAGDTFALAAGMNHFRAG